MTEKTKGKSEKRAGLSRCPRCGATDAKFDLKTGTLKCSHCRSAIDKEIEHGIKSIRKLSGEVIGDAAKNVAARINTTITFTCSACGSSVVVLEREELQARCHWCRHVLSLDEKATNSAMPDAVLPFKLSKAEAKRKIEKLIESKSKFANRRFLKEFKSENIVGVYLPYMMADVNGEVELAGEAERQVRSYVGDAFLHKRKDFERYDGVQFYDAERYRITRKCDLLIEGLTIESSKSKIRMNPAVDTNNVINSIMPFDVENCVAWNANYLKGFASEKRDVDVKDLRPILEVQVNDIARHRAGNAAQYDRGVRWDLEHTKIKGVRWRSVYLPVWLYSYHEGGKKDGKTHYCVVNARTGETAGSIPFDKGVVLSRALVIWLIGAGLCALWMMLCSRLLIGRAMYVFGALGMTPGFIYYWWATSKYSSDDLRHKYEYETRVAIENMQSEDVSYGVFRELRNHRIAGENGNKVYGAYVKGERKMSFGEKLADDFGIADTLGKKKL